MEETPEDFLEYSDWMGIPMIPYPVTLDRFQSLLCDAANKLQ
jgi:cephalosporin hydroxylase